MRASIIAIFAALAPLCLANTAPPVTIRIPKRVRVSVDRYEDADGNVRIGREFSIGYYEKPLDGDDDYYRAVECGVVGLDVRLVHRCDCTRATGTRERPRTNRDDGRDGAAVDVSYNLFLYVDDGDRRATYFSAAVNGDVVVRREGGSTATVPGGWLDSDGGLFGPSGTRTAGAESRTTGSDRRPSARRTARAGEDQPAAATKTVEAETIDAIDERAFKAWLSREFSNDRIFGNAGGDVADGPTGAFGRDPRCVEIPQDRAGDFRDFLPATGCYRVFSDRRCTGVSKMLFWRAESLNERGVFASAPADRDSPSFRVQSVTGCCRPRRERPLDHGVGGSDDEELVWSPSFSADGDYPRPRDDGPDKCACGSPASTATEPSADTATAEPPASAAQASSSSDSAAPSTDADTSTKTSADNFAELSSSAETKNKISTESSPSVPVASLDSTNGMTEPIAKIQMDNFEGPSASVKTKNKIVTEPLSNVAEDDSTIGALASTSINLEAPLTSNDSLTKPVVDAPVDNFTEPLASVETEKKIATEPLSNVGENDSTIGILESSSINPETSLTSNDSLTKPIVDTPVDNFTEPLASVETDKNIATEPLSSADADDSTTIISTSEPSSNTVVSTIDQSTGAMTDKLDELADDEGNETATVPTFVDGAKKVVSVAWTFLSSLAEKILMSTWFAYKSVVQHTWMDGKESS